MLYSKASLPGARHILQSSNPLHAHFNVNFFLIFRTTETCLLPTNCVIYCFVRRQCLCVEHRITTSNVCSKNMCTLTEKQLVLNIQFSKHICPRQTILFNVSYLYEMCLAFYLNVDSHSFTNMLRICLCFPPAFLTPFKPLTLQSKCKSLSCFLSMEFYVKNADTLHEQLKLRFVISFV